MKVHLAILGLAALLLAPAAVAPPMTHDSFWIDWVWSDQFAAELSRGQLYPRWLPLSNSGLGSATFYFYPPLAFYVSGTLGLLGFSTYGAIIGCFAIGLIISGYAMFAWLQGTPHPLAGALLFMAGPYHMLDFYGRGAQAEFFAIGLIPLVALGLRRNREGRPALLALAYAALILTHLPLALLASIFLIAPLLVWHRDLPRGAIPLALGVAMAAVYLLPALALEKYRHSELLWSHPSLQPENWSLIFWQNGPASGMRSLFALILIALAVPTAVLWFSGQRKAALYAALCSIIAAGVVPGVWKLPLLADVQFPFRILPLVEFAIATGIARIANVRPAFLIAGIPAFALTALFALNHPPTGPFTIAELAATHPDMAENGLRQSTVLPSWPVDVGLMISIAAAAAAIIYFGRGKALLGRRRA